MAHGGRRPGAGRKPGKTSKLAMSEAIVKAVESKMLETPLEYMLRIMMDETADPDRRDRMACAAAPYVHARRSEVDVTANVTRRVLSEPVSPQQWLEQTKTSKPLMTQ